MKCFLVFGVTILVSACTSQPKSQGQAETREESTIRLLENQVTLPLGAYPLNRYDRFYAFTDAKVKAIYKIPRGRSGNVHIVEEDRLPIKFDGGCGVVNIIFDTRTNAFEEIVCNGIA